MSISVTDFLLELGIFLLGQLFHFEVLVLFVILTVLSVVGKDGENYVPKEGFEEGQSVFFREWESVYLADFSDLAVGLNPEEEVAALSIQKLNCFASDILIFR